MKYVWPVYIFGLGHVLLKFIVELYVAFRFFGTVCDCHVTCVVAWGYSFFFTKL